MGDSKWTQSARCKRFAPSVHRNLGRVHVQHYALWRIGFSLADEFAVDAGQALEVLLLGQHLGLKSLQAGSQRRTTIPSFLGTDQPEGRILRNSLGIVDILIAGDATVDGLAQKVRQRKLGVLPMPRVGQVLGDEIAEAQAFVQLADQNQAAVGGDPRSLEIHLQRGVEGKLKWPVLSLTHWVLTSGVSSLRSNPHE